MPPPRRRRSAIDGVVAGDDPRALLYSSLASITSDTVDQTMARLKNIDRSRLSESDLQLLAAAEAIAEEVTAAPAPPAQAAAAPPDEHAGKAMADTEADAAPADDLPDAEPLDAVDVQPATADAPAAAAATPLPAEAPRTVAPVTNVPAAAHAEAPSPETADPTADVVAEARKKLEEIDKLMKDTVAMTEGVTQAAAMPVAVHGPSGGRHGRRHEDAAGAFGEALGTSNAPHRAEAGAAAKPRANAWRQTGIAAWCRNGRDRRRAAEGRPLRQGRHRRQADADGIA